MLCIYERPRLKFSLVANGGNLFCGFVLSGVNLTLLQPELSPLFLFSIFFIIILLSLSVEATGIETS